MRGVLLVLADSLRRLRSSMVGWVVVSGLVLMPCLFSWFVTLAFWDPTAHTGDLSVAVANEDAGYTSSTLPFSIDAGASLVDDLRANPKFHWEFVSAQEAREGVESGRYYAAVVIPQDFSRDLASVFSGADVRPQITYVVNQKVNAIAPHVTGVGMTDLTDQLDATFAQSVTKAALEVGEDLAGALGDDQLQAVGTRLVASLRSGADQLGQDATLARTFAVLLGQTDALLGASAQGVGSLGSVAQGAVPLLEEAERARADATQAAQSAGGLMAGTLSQTEGSLTSLQEASNRAFDALEGDPAALQEGIAAVDRDLASLQGAYEQARQAVAAADPQSPLLASLDEAVTSLGAARDALAGASQAVATGADDVAARRGEVAAAFADAEQAVQDLRQDTVAEAGPTLDALSAQLEGLGSQAQEAAQALSQASASVSQASTEARGGVQRVREALDTAAGLLETSSATVTDACDRLDAALASGDLAAVRRIIGGDPELLAELLVAPVQVEKHAVFAMADYGSAMSPFYTSMGLFIGALFSVIICQVRLTPERLRQLGPLRPWQCYLGLGLFFELLALAQGALMAVGNLFFLQVQCDSVPLYFAACEATAFTFVAIAFSLAAAFGRIGNAATLILLVLQIGGSGGLMPIQLSAPFFQAVYPWLPFVHSMAAFQGAMAGVYGTQYLDALLCLSGYVAASLVVGLVLRAPLAKLNQWLLDQMARTGMM